MRKCSGCKKEMSFFTICLEGVQFCRDCEHKLALRFIEDLIHRHIEWEKYMTGKSSLTEIDVLSRINWRKMIK